MTRLLRLTFAAALLTISAFAEENTSSDWWKALHLTATAGVTEIDNISRTSDPATRKDATTYELQLSHNQPRQLARNLLLIGTLEATALQVPDYDLTNNLRLGGRVALQTKFGLGAQATVLQFSAGGTYKAARFADDRGWTTEAGMQLAKRVLPGLRLAANARVLEHSARSAVFDLNQHTFSAEAQWDINPQWTLSGQAGRLSGDIVANAGPAVWATMLAGGFGPAIFNSYTSRPWDVTNLYGANWVSYLVEGDVDLWSVALGYAFNDRTSMEVRKSGAYVINQVGVTYPTDSWGLTLSHRF